MHIQNPGLEPSSVGQGCLSLSSTGLGGQREQGQARVGKASGQPRDECSQAISCS